MSRVLHLPWAPSHTCRSQSRTYLHKKCQEWHPFSIFIQRIWELYCFIISRECQIAFSKVSYFNIQYCYSEDLKLLCCWCDEWPLKGARFTRSRPLSSVRLSRLQTHRSPDLSAACPRYLSVSAGSGVSIKAHIKYVNVRIIHRADNCLSFYHKIICTVHWTIFSAFDNFN